MTISRARLILLACASGLLYPLSFPAFDLGIVAWFALVPLHIAVEYLSPGRAFRIGWLSGTLAFTGSMFWVITAMNVYGKVPFPIATLVMLLLTVYLGLFIRRRTFVDPDSVPDPGLPTRAVSLGDIGTDPYLLSLRLTLGTIRIFPIPMAPDHSAGRPFRGIRRLLPPRVGQLCAG